MFKYYQKEIIKGFPSFYFYIEINKKKNEAKRPDNKNSLISSLR